MISPNLQPLKPKALTGRTALSLQQLAGARRGVHMHAPVTKVIDHTKLAWLHHEGLADIHAYLDILRLQHGGNVPSKSGHGGANEH